MTELSLTDDQLERLQEVADDLEATYVGSYGTVRPEDAIDYLLDTYTAPSEANDGDEAADTDGEDEATEEDEANDGDDEDEVGESNGSAGDASSAGGAARLQSMMSMLDDFDDKWRRAENGEEPYEVDLPDGGTESARTKDDVRRILFQQYH